MPKLIALFHTYIQHKQQHVRRAKRKLETNAEEREGENNDVHIDCYSKSTVLFAFSLQLPVLVFFCFLHCSVECFVQMENYGQTKHLWTNKQQ